MKIIIEGAGEVGSHLAKMLSNEANEIISTVQITNFIMKCGAHGDKHTTVQDIDDNDANK